MTTATTISLGSQILNMKKKVVDSKDYMNSHAISRIKDHELYAPIIQARVKTLVHDIKHGLLDVLSFKNDFEIKNGLVSICHSTDKIYQAELLCVTKHDTTLIQYLNHIQTLHGVDISESISDIQSWMQNNEIPEIIVAFNSSNKSWDLPFNEFLIKFND